MLVLNNSEAQMRTPAQVIQVLESDNSRLAKEAVIATEAQAGNTDFFKG